MSAVVRSPETLMNAMKDDLEKQRYVVTGMDGETFGHHRPGLEKMLFEVFKTSEFKLVNISDLDNLYKSIEEISPVKSTWASSKKNIDQGVQFLSWSDPENILHTMQWQLVNLVLCQVNNMKKGSAEYDEVRKKMDRSLASDHFWWASAKPWWSMEMIEDGAYHLLDTLRSIPNVNELILNKAGKLYEDIVSTGFNWQRTGKIKEMMHHQKNTARIPFVDRTIGQHGAEEGVFHAFIEMMKQLEKQAADKQEYEKAILWRDAMYKLKNKLDIYDTINAIDLLRIEISNETVEKTILKYKEEYSRLRGGQPEQRGS